MRYVLGDTAILENILKENAKIWYQGPMFRYERPQTGRMRQFYQLGIENIGGSPKNKVYSDFQTISSAIEILD